MKTLSKVAVAVLLGLSLTACDKASEPAKPAEQPKPAAPAAEQPKAPETKPAEAPKVEVVPAAEVKPEEVAKPAGESAKVAPAEVAKAAPAVKVDLSKYIPAVDASLLEPIAISDKKSETGAADLAKFGDWSAKAEQTIMAATQKLLQVAGQSQGKPSDAFQAAFKDFTDLYSKTTDELAKLDVKDAEVKTVAERNVKLLKFASDTMVKAISAALELESASPEVQQQYIQASSAAKQQLENAKMVLAKAVQDLLAKYSPQQPAEPQKEAAPAKK